MRKTRVFVDTIVQVGEIITLDSETTHYLGRVLKLRVGEVVQAFNGRGGCYDSEIISLDKRLATIRPLLLLADNRQSKLNLTLAQGISRGQHMDYTVQKAVELGVRRIVPLFTEFSNVRLQEDRARKRHEHWHKVIISACEQCGLNIPPELAEAVPLRDWVSTDSSAVKLLMHPDAPAGLSTLIAEANNITLLCGPEGGLSPDEIDYALQQGYQKVSLGPRILRTETAAIAAAAVCQALRGDMLYNQPPKE